MKPACRKMRDPFSCFAHLRDQHQDDFLTFQITGPHPLEQCIVNNVFWANFGCPSEEQLGRHDLQRVELRPPPSWVWIKSMPIALCIQKFLQSLSKCSFFLMDHLQICIHLGWQALNEETMGLVTFLIKSLSPNLKEVHSLSSQRIHSHFAQSWVLDTMNLSKSVFLFPFRARKIDFF